MIFTSNQSLPPGLVLHPNKQLRDSGYTQNIEAEIEPRQHDKALSTAEHGLDATTNGPDLGFSEKQTRQFVKEAKRTN